MTEKCYDYDKPCDCMDDHGTHRSGNAIASDWNRKIAALLSQHGLHYMNDPGGGGFYTKAGQRLMSDGYCPEGTHARLSKLLAEQSAVEA